MKYACTPFRRPGVIQNFAVGLFFSLVSCLVSPLPIARAAQTLIQFDDQFGDFRVDNYYPGVTFTNPLGGGVFARQGTGYAPSPPDSAPSPPNVVSVYGPGTLSFFDARD